MKLPSTQFLKTEIRQDFQECREKTLDLVANIDEHRFCQQIHPDFSPVGWHLGHIAYTEAYWILERCAGLSPQFPQYHQLFAADGLPKAQRQQLPRLADILDYLHTIRTQVFTYLETAPLIHQERLWRWLVQHETQHNETMTFILQLFEKNSLSFSLNLAASLPETPMVLIPKGEFLMGSNTIDAMDNERPQHRVMLDSYAIDIYPVTCQQYRQFIISGGYQQQKWWSEEGWKWLQDNPVSHPLYWSNSSDWNDHPVCGVSYYEAEAYANFVGKRLPTEAEWEKAASWQEYHQTQRKYPWGSQKPNAKLANYNLTVGHTTPVTAYPLGQSAYGCYDMLGNVWEWTRSWFEGYERFAPYPYIGYSQAYFDQKHRVLRGGSYATRPWGLRNSFRNWYHPWVRQILAGFRCVK